MHISDPSGLQTLEEAGGPDAPAGRRLQLGLRSQRAETELREAGEGPPVPPSSGAAGGRRPMLLTLHPRFLETLQSQALPRAPHNLPPTPHRGARNLGAWGPIPVSQPCGRTGHPGPPGHLSTLRRSTRATGSALSPPWSHTGRRCRGCVPLRNAGLISHVVCRTYQGVYP